MRKTYPELSKTVALTLILVLLSLYLVQAASPQVANNTIVRAQPSTSNPQVGETFTVSVTIENVQKLYGIDMALSWNDSVLQVVSVDLRLGLETHSDGVLHGNRLNYDVDTVVSGDIYVIEENVLGEYSLTALTIGSVPFSGSGTIVNITFKAITIGYSTLDLHSPTDPETKLAEYPQPGEQSSNYIEHTDVDGSIESTENGVVEPNTDWLTPIVIALIIVALILVISALFYFRKRPKKNTAQQP